MQEAVSEKKEMKEFNEIIINIHDPTVFLIVSFSRNMFIESIN